MNLFIDIDGVLLGKSPVTQQPALATHAEEFISFCLLHFNCYWLTTHCKGDVQTALDYLTPYSKPSFIEMLKNIKPSHFKTFKTEALFGDFYWIDDQPTAYEIQYLDENEVLDRWLQVNTCNNIDELESIINFFKQHQQIG
ncbi:MAG: hypothetical protein ISR69_10355 [Gammaproteobacteria bacterium]|nr:hypothetical protein [Gammaproteobacteria bacterium]